MSFQLNGLRIFMGIIFCYGIFLLIFSLKTSVSSDNCNTTKVQDAIKALIIISTMMVSVSFTFMLCGCGKSHKGSTLTHGLLLLFVWGLSISNIVFGQIIVANCDEYEPKHDAKVIRDVGITMCTLITAWVVLYLVLCIHYKGEKNIFLLSELAMCDNKLSHGGMAGKSLSPGFSFH